MLKWKLKIFQSELSLNTKCKYRENKPKDYDYNKATQSAYRRNLYLLKTDGFTGKQMQYIEDSIDQSLLEQEVEFSTFFSNLQLEMMRQFMIQKDELVGCLKSKLKNDLDPYL